MRLLAYIFLWSIALCPTAWGAASGGIDLLPGPPSVDRHQQQRPPTEGLEHPGTAALRESRPDTVHLLFPQDLAKFVNHSIVTLAWRPPDTSIFPYPARQHPVEYRISVVGEYAREQLIHLPMREPKVTTHCMVQLDIPGKYRWQVAAVMPNLVIIQSEVRIFTILPD